MPAKLSSRSPQSICQYINNLIIKVSQQSARDQGAHCGLKYNRSKTPKNYSTFCHTASFSLVVFAHQLLPERAVFARAARLSQVCEAHAGRRLKIDATSEPWARPSASQIHHEASTPLRLGRLESSLTEKRVPQQTSAVYLSIHRKPISPVCLCAAWEGTGMCQTSTEMSVLGYLL